MSVVAENTVLIYKRLEASARRYCHCTAASVNSLQKTQTLMYTGTIIGLQLASRNNWNRKHVEMEYRRKFSHRPI